MNEFVTITSFSQQADLIVARARLESDGIECNTVDELTVQVDNFISQAIGGIKLQVRKSDVDQAMQTLNEIGALPEIVEEIPIEQRPAIIQFTHRISKNIPILNEVVLEIRLLLLVVLLIAIFAIPLVLILD